MVPGAALVSTVALQEKLPPSLRGIPIQTSWLQRMPGMKKHYRLYFLLYPFAVQSLDLSRFDLVLSSSSGYAKGIRTHGSSLHVCYCHTPMRWVWNFNDYSARERMGTARRMLLQAVIEMLRIWDEDAARQPDHFIANSRAVARRIAKVYGRVAEVIHPPIDVDRFHSSKELDDYYLVLSAHSLQANRSRCAGLHNAWSQTDCHRRRSSISAACRPSRRNRQVHGPSPRL